MDTDKRREDTVREFQALCDCLLVECGVLVRMWKGQVPEEGPPRAMVKLMNRVLDLRLKVGSPECAAEIEALRKAQEEVEA